MPGRIAPKTTPLPSQTLVDASVKGVTAAATELGVVSARARVQQLQSQVAGVGRELEALRRKTADFTDPSGALDAAKKLKGTEAKLSGLEVKLTGAKAALETAEQLAVTTSKAAIAAQQRANREALFELRPPPFLQVGQHSPTLSRQQAVSSAAERFKAAKTSFDAAAVLQNAFRLNPDAEFQAALWSEARGRLPALAKAGDLPTMRSLVAIAEHGGLEVERDIAAALAKGAPGYVMPMSAPYADPFVSGPVAHLKQAIKETGRLNLAHRFSEALTAAGKPMAASAVASAAADQLSALRADFVAKQKKVDGLNAKLGMLVAGFGPMLTDAQKRSAIAAFQARHTDDFKAHEAAAKKLAQGLSMAAEIAGGSPKTDGEKALQKQAKEVLKLAGAIANTRAGEAELKAAMEKEAKGGASWVASAMSLAQNVKDGEKIAGTLGTAVMRTLALDAAKLVEGNLPLAMEKVANIAHYAKLMGIDPAKADALGGAMVGMLKGREGAGRVLEKAVLDLEGTPLVPPAGRLSSALKGVGVVLSVYSLRENGFGDDAFEKLKSVTTGLHASADALAVGLELFSKSPALKGLAETASKKLGAITGAFDFVSGYRSLFKGDFEEAGTTLMSSAGALMMMTPGGQIPGALLTVGSIVAGWVFASRRANAAEAADEADAKAFLQAAGIHEKIAAPLSDLLQKNRRNVGAFLTQLEAHLNLKPGELLQRLNKPELAGKVRQLVTIIKDIEPGRDGQYAKRASTDAMAKANDYVHVRAGMELDFRPKSLEAVADWMKQQKLFGG